jgi:hypothetical protein
MPSVLPKAEYQLAQPSAKEKQLVELLLSDLRAPIFVVDPDPGMAVLVKRHISGYMIAALHFLDHYVMSLETKLKWRALHS